VENDHKTFFSALNNINGLEPQMHSTLKPNIIYDVFEQSLGVATRSGFQALSLCLEIMMKR